MHNLILNKLLLFSVFCAVSTMAFASEESTRAFHYPYANDKVCVVHMYKNDEAFNDDLPMEKTPLRIPAEDSTALTPALIKSIVDTETRLTGTLLDLKSGAVVDVSLSNKPVQLTLYDDSIGTFKMFSYLVSTNQKWQKESN